MTSCLPVRPCVHNAPASPAAPAALRFVPKSHAPRAATKPWPKIGDAWGRARHAIDLLEDRWVSARKTSTGSRARYATRKMARRAIHELIDLAALVGLHLPLRTRRDREAESVIVGQVIAAMECACGCSRCRNDAGGAP